MSYYTFPAQALNVVDGDTYDLFVDEGMDGYRKIRVRLKGVDTGEIFGTRKDSEEYQKGMEQKQFAEEFLEPEEKVDFDFDLSVRTVDKGKYGRYVARIWKDGEELTEALVEEWPEVADS